MAQIEQSDGGKKKKGAQKKMQIHVDFTPMVDMNMLLITFFMLCTTMIKSQTLSITLPAPPEENATVDNSDTMADSRALTLIIDTKRDADGKIVYNEQGKPADVIYFYHGQVTAQDGKFLNVNGEEIQNPMDMAEFIGNEGSGANTQYFGIRDILRKKNKEVVDSIDIFKEQWRLGKLDDDQFNDARRRVATNRDLNSAQVSIKATDRASWESIISALDEMQINGITQYRIGTFNSQDSTILADYKQKHGITD